jgi:uncharacterized protein YndB with AHSA1/START domain
MPVIALTTIIDAPVDRVWRALCDPSEVVLWDSGLIDALDAPADYPQPGQHVRWRVRDSDTLLHDRLQHVEPNQRLSTLLDFGGQHIDETYVLTPLADDRTRVELKLDVSNKTPALGAILALLVDLPNVRLGSETSLARLKRHCEAG